MKRRYIIFLFLFTSSSLFGVEGFTPVFGVNGEAGHNDGAGSGALFNDPVGLARDAGGNIYVCDARNHVIRKISPQGVVSTLAGEVGVAGAEDGNGSAARFNFPVDIAVSPDGNLYVADSGNNCIRSISPSGDVRIFAGNPDSDDDIKRNFGSAYSVVPARLDGKGSDATFSKPSGIAYGPGGFLYVSDTGNHIIRRVDLNGSVVTLAGMPGVWGNADGVRTNARFNAPMGLCVTADGSLYIADSNNHVIRRMTQKMVVSTFSGNSNESGSHGGTSKTARFSEPMDITPHPDGGFIVCESFGNSLFRLNSQGDVTLFAGDTDGQQQTLTTGLSGPGSAVCDTLGNVYVADTFNHQIRLIVENFERSIAVVDGRKQMTISWDSASGRNYQLQVLGEEGWENTDYDPIRATTGRSSFTFDVSQNEELIYRVTLLGGFEPSEEVALAVKNSVLSGSTGIMTLNLTTYGTDASVYEKDNTGRVLPKRNLVFENEFSALSAAREVHTYEYASKITASKITNKQFLEALRDEVGLIENITGWSLVFAADTDRGLEGFFITHKSYDPINVSNYLSLLEASDEPVEAKQENYKFIETYTVKSNTSVISETGSYRGKTLVKVESKLPSSTISVQGTLDETEILRPLSVGSMPQWLPGARTIRNISGFMSFKNEDKSIVVDGTIAIGAGKIVDIRPFFETNASR